MYTLLKQLASKLPSGAQEELQRWSYRRRIRRGKLGHNEPEFLRLSDWVHDGDTVLDVGANIGIFTLRLSELVGAQGHVFAFEPVARTFGLLTANARLTQHNNVTLINAAAADATSYVTLRMPFFESGLVAYTRASIQEVASNQPMQAMQEYRAFAFPIDGLQIPARVSFVKIDVEGHELFVLQGMSDLIVRDRPTIVLEGDDARVVEFLQARDYQTRRLDNSPNTIFEPTDTAARRDA